MGKINKKKTLEETTTNNMKKPFDKKKWRERKYSKKVKCKYNSVLFVNF